MRASTATPGQIRIEVDSSQMIAAINSLSEVAKTSREVVQRFLDGLDSLSHLVCVYSDVVVAPRAGESRIVLQPSDLLVEFLLAARAGECNGV